MSIQSIALASLLALGAQAGFAQAVGCSPGVEGCSFALDGVTPAEFSDRRTNTAYWVGTPFGQPGLVTIRLGSTPLTLVGLQVSLAAPNNYQIEHSLDGQSWTTLGVVAVGDGNVDFGMDTLTSEQGSPDYLPGLAFQPVQAKYLQVRGMPGGTTLYSVGEVIWTAAAVPEPTSWALLLGGLGALAWRRKAVC